jgi:Flp pilus assembly protein TadD
MAKWVQEVIRTIEHELNIFTLLNVSALLFQASGLDVANIMRAVKADKSAGSPAKVAFLEKVRQSNAACQNGDFERAVALYTEAIQLDPANHILYSNRSAAHIKMGQFAKALQDAVKAKELNPEWPKVLKDKSLLSK